MHHPILTRNFTADGAITKRRIVKPGGSDGEVAAAAAADDDLIGVADELGQPKDDARVDVHLAGIAAVEYGGAVTRGAPLTANADGKAVAAARPAIRLAVVTGAGANTDITVSGLSLGDELLGVAATDGTVVVEPSIRAEDKLRSVGTTANKKLLVVWRKPGVSVIGRALVAGVSGDIGYLLLAPGRI